MDGVQRPGKLPPLNPNYKPQLKYLKPSYPQEPSVKVFDQTEDLENSFEINAYDFRNTFKSKPDKSEDTSEFDYTPQNRFKFSRGINQAQANTLDISKEQSMNQTNCNEQFPSMVYIASRNGPKKMESLQKSKPFTIKHKHEPPNRLSEKEDEKPISKFDDSNSKKFNFSKRDTAKRNRYSIDDSELKNTLKSDEFYNTTNSNKFGDTRRKSNDFSRNIKREDSVSQNERPSSLANEHNNPEQNDNSRSDDLDELVNTDSDDEYDINPIQDSGSIPTPVPGLRIELKKSSFRHIL